MLSRLVSETVPVCLWFSPYVPAARLPQTLARLGAAVTKLAARGRGGAEGAGEKYGGEAEPQPNGLP